MPVTERIRKSAMREQVLGPVLFPMAGRFQQFVSAAHNLDGLSEQLAARPLARYAVPPLSRLPS